MKRTLFVLLLIIAAACDEDHSPTKPPSTGIIKIILETRGIEEKRLPDTLSAGEKAARPARLSQLEVRVLKADNTLHASQAFTPSEGVFNVIMNVKAEDNLKVLCIGTVNGTVEYFGIDEDVDVQARKTTTALITGWTDPYIPRITGITPNPSTNGSYTVLWSQSTNADTYVLQEADNQEFSGAVASYSTTGLQINISGKGAGTRYYRIRADNEYDITSGWSTIESAVVQNTHTISGAVSGADGVLVTLDGDASDTRTVNDGGTFSFVVAEGGSYTVTPSKKGYSFTPPVQTYDTITSSQTRDYSCSRNSYTISGTVTGADDVMILLGGDVSDSRTVDDGGAYSFSVGGGGSYTVTPFKTGCLFNPASSSFFEIVSDQTLNFTGTSSLTHTLSGTVSGADGVTITLGGGASGSQVVNDGGSYSFVVADGGSYTLTPTKSGYMFTPAGGTFTNVTSDQAQNFTAQVITHTISGTVTGAEGVTIALSGDSSGSTVVNSDGGSYSFVVADGGSYTVTPTKSGYTFTPSEKAFNSVTSNNIQNFTAVIETYTISGTITGADGVTVALSGHKSQSLSVDDGGTYSFTVEYGYNYTVTPSKDEFTFTPASWTFSNVIANQTQNFTAVAVIPIEITMVSIPGGTFEMGDVENSGDSDEKPVHTVTLSGFEMSIYEVTNAQYAAYLNEAMTSGDIDVVDGDVYGKTGAWTGQMYMDIGYEYDSNNKCWIQYGSGVFSVTSGYENWPVVAITWYGSKSFALYYGLDLPTESEWEYSCRGGRQYEYGTDDGTISSSNANYFWNVGHPTDVGSYPANPYGLYDMSGNVWEWCNDWYGSYSSGSVNNPSGAQTGSSRVYRGGCWISGPAEDCQAAGRAYNSPAYRSVYDGVGFRVVRRSETQNIYSISGTVTGADGVLVILSGDASDSQTVNSGGSYSFTVAEGGTYTITPTKGGYTFTPPSQTFSNITSNQTQNFTAEVIPSAGGRIAFTSNRDGNGEIYVMDADGSSQRNLTNNPAFDCKPSWSPDGSRIAFHSNRDVNFEIYVMDADGSNQRRLTNNPAFDYWPSWSPDGTRIAFSSNRDVNFEIYVMDADGSNQRNLTNNPADDYAPSWSPDGAWIAFVSYRDGNYEIYVMDADGSSQRNLTNNTAYDDYPSWSPDGSRIAFSSNRDVNFEIYVMDADGSNQRRLTNNPAFDYWPSWSPDGTRIAFSSNRDVNFEIYVMDADGSNQRNLTNNPESDYYPSWSPDGALITFLSSRDGNYEIYVMNADGSNKRNLTNNPANDEWPSWSPF